MKPNTTAEVIKEMQERARKTNEGYRQMAGDVLMGGLPDIVLDILISEAVLAGEKAGRDGTIAKIEKMKLKYELSKNNKIFNLSIDEVIEALTKD